MTAKPVDPKQYLSVLQHTLRIVQTTPELHDSIRAHLLDSALDVGDSNLNADERNEFVSSIATAFDGLMFIVGQDSPRALAESVREAVEAAL